MIYSPENHSGGTLPFEKLMSPSRTPPPSIAEDEDILLTGGEKGASSSSIRSKRRKAGPLDLDSGSPREHQTQNSQPRFNQRDHFSTDTQTQLLLLIATAEVNKREPAIKSFDLLKYQARRRESASNASVETRDLVRDPAIFHQRYTTAEDTLRDFIDRRRRVDRGAGGEAAGTNSPSGIKARSQRELGNTALSPSITQPSMEAQQQTDVSIVVSRESLETARNRLRRQLYVIQKKPEGFPNVPLWSVNSSLEQSLKGPTFASLTVERKNRVLESIAANFRFVNANNNSISQAGGSRGVGGSQTTGGGVLQGGPAPGKTEVGASGSPQAGSSALGSTMLHNTPLASRATAISPSSSVQRPPRPSHHNQQLGLGSQNHSVALFGLTADTNVNPSHPSRSFLASNQTSSSGSNETRVVTRPFYGHQHSAKSLGRSFFNPHQQTRILPPSLSSNSAHSHPQPSRPQLAGPGFVPSLSASQNASSQIDQPRNSRVRFSTSHGSASSQIGGPEFSGSRMVSTSSHSKPLSLSQQKPPAIQPGAPSRPQSFREGVPEATRSPSSLSVVIGVPRPIATPNTQANSSMFKIELPSSTPEKLLSRGPSHTLLNSASVKKRGRPFASKEAEHRAMVKAANKLRKQAEGPGHYPKKNQGRPSKAPSRHVEIAVPEWKFQVFRCKFAGCAAQLVNAETLRKHLYTVHGPKMKRDPVTKKYDCLWVGCCELADEHNGYDLEPERRYRSDLKFKRKTGFDTLDQWKDHIEEVHMWYVLWTQGDGPKSQDLKTPKKSQSLYEREPWLFDKDGKQVTPSVDLSKTYHESPKEHYTKLFKRTREDGEWVYFLKEDLESMHLKKKSKFLRGAEGEAMQSAGWEDVPEDVAEGQTFLGQVCR